MNPYMEVTFIRLVTGVYRRHFTGDAHVCHKPIVFILVQRETNKTDLGRNELTNKMSRHSGDESHRIPPPVMGCITVFAHYFMQIMNGVGQALLNLVGHSRIAIGDRH